MNTEQTADLRSADNEQIMNAEQTADLRSADNRWLINDY